VSIEERAAAISAVEAVRLARDLYGLEASARPLPGEYDDNFQLRTPEGRELVLKVMHPARERGLVELQCAALRHLALAVPHLALPRVVEDRRGEAVADAPGPEGSRRLVWMLTFVPGAPLAEARPRTPELLASLGRLLGELDRALLGFFHPGASRELKWDLARAAQARRLLPCIADPGRRALAERFFRLYAEEAEPALPRLRRSVIHGDANDWNVLVAAPRAETPEAVSVIDFGDMHLGLTVAEVAVAAAYALLGQRDPLRAASAVVGGYHAVFPLEEEEIRLLFPLIAARLAVSVAHSAERGRLLPDDPYARISEEPAFAALERLAGIPPRLAHYTFRAACSRPPVPEGEELVRWLRDRGREAASVLDLDTRTAASLVLDLGVGSLFLGADPRQAETGPLTEAIFGAMKKAGAEVGVGRYDEARLLYVSPLFGDGAAPTEERRTVHLGIDLFVPEGSAVRAPLDGTVHLLANNRSPQDYGPLVVLRHETGEGRAVFTLYGHLSEDTLDGLAAGQSVARGQAFARVGAPPGNGGWPPHLHFQIVLDLLDMGAGFPGVARASEREVWKALSPDPNLLLGIPASRFPEPEPSREATLLARRSRLGPNLSLSYRRPLKIVRGFMQYLYDETGRAYLDAYNNVPLVGHSHPRVVRAVQAQLALLNTNTRYLHDSVLRYAERLTRRLPEPLRVFFFLNSGSEANELALRLARARTGRPDVIVLEHAYHGNTQGLIEVSPYKFAGAGGAGRRSFVHVAPIPDDYRGAYRRGDPEAGPKYARHVAQIVERLRATGRGVGTYLAETLPSVAGQIVLPPGYLAEAYRHVRAAGGVCIADEVQVGFGRLGSHFWGFETQGVVPDVVVLGKPIGNGFPLAAVVTTAEIAGAFDNGMEFFSTFGGNPVAAAAGLAVLDVLEEEGLQERARRAGAHFRAGLAELMGRHPLIGDVRGSGLYLGVELVRDRGSREPATKEAAYVVDRLRERGLLTGTDGPHDNVLKLRPPLVFTEADAEAFVAALDDILGEDAIRPGGGWPSPPPRG
jgi:4-aminobutyrate aminotransferase-like enzyme/Ser/Thr protein kinase RdoA (MazF antagonist)